MCVFITFTGCRSVDKDWLKENYVSKAEATLIKTEALNETQRLNAATESNLNAKYEQFVQEVKQSENSNENETTKISGTIEAEEGKEKTAEIGDTKIKSNGATISFETTSTKEISKAFESRYQQLEQKLLEESKKTEQLQSQLNSLKSEIANLRSNQETEKTTKSKEKNSKGLTFGAVITILIILVIVGLVWYYWSKIKLFLGRFRK